MDSGRDAPDTTSAGLVELAHEADFHLGSLQVRPSTREVLSSNGRERIEPRVMQLLTVLARADGRVVSRDALIDSCWGGLVVGEDAINRAIGKLRRLGERTGAFELETITKVGYRLNPPDATDGARLVGTRHRPKTPLRWIALAAVCVAIAAGLTAWMLRPRTWALESFSKAVLSPMLELHPAISPDGSFLAYAADPGNGPRDIWLQRIGGGEPVRFTEDPADDHAPVWSPSGDRIAFVRTDGRPCRILIKPFPAGPEREAGRCRRDLYSRLAWSKDGGSLYMIDGPNGRDAGAPHAVFRLDLDDGRRVQITHPAGGDGDHEPVLSPDGRRLLFGRETPEAFAVYALDLRSGVERRITPPGLDAFAFNWMPSGRDVLVAPDSPGGSTLWVYPAGDGKPRQIASFLGEIGRLSLGPGGLFAAEINDHRERLAYAPGGEADRFAASKASMWAADVGANGVAAFAGILGDQSGLWSVSGNRPARPLLDPPSKPWTLRWSPDGRRIAFGGRYHGATGVFVVGADGGRVTKLAPASVATWIDWTPDGRGLFYTSGQGSDLALWRVELAAPGQPRLVQRGICAVRVAAGGVYVAEPRGSSVRRLGGGREPVETLPVSVPACLDWTAAGRFIAYKDMSDAHAPRIVVKDLPSGSTRVWPAPKMSGVTPIAVNPVTGRPLYAQVQETDADIALFRLTRR
jgi:Tol biopolymer transport system component/DNA-binding winged helix-turn-helix (wHTH) protein